jgi:hypothetical protein
MPTCSAIRSPRATQQVSARRHHRARPAVKPEGDDDYDDGDDDRPPDVDILTPPMLDLGPYDFDMPSLSNSCDQGLQEVGQIMVAAQALAVIGREVGTGISHTVAVRTAAVVAFAFAKVLFEALFIDWLLSRLGRSFDKIPEGARGG